MASIALMLNNMLRRLQDSKDRWLLWFKDTTVKVVLIFLLVTLQLWLSIFLFGSFYYAYMPAVAHLKPVFLQFSSTCDRFSGSESCPFPHSNTTLVKSPHSRLLMKGQKYKVTLEIDMPQSPTNEELGVFMVKLDFFSFHGQPTMQSLRPAMIRYRSPFVKMLEVISFAPLLITGYSEEKQLLKVTLLDDFTDNSYKPVLGAYVELQARKIEVYSSVLKIQAHFTGLRYFMYYWPISSSFVGIGSFFLLLSIFTMLSWQQCAGSFWKSADLEDIPVRFPQPKQITYEERQSIMKRNMEKERLSLFQDRPQFVTVSSSSQLDPAPKPRLRPSRSDSSLPVDEGPSSTSLSADFSEFTGRVESLSQSDDGDKRTASELSETTTTTTEANAPEKSPDQESSTNQESRRDEVERRASESSDEAHGFEKLEPEEVEKDTDMKKVEEVKTMDGEGTSKNDLETPGACEVPDTELRYRQGHGTKEETH